MEGNINTSALAGGLNWLQERCRENTRPEEARRLLRDFQARHPELDIDLVWEEEDYSGAVHYDLLIRPDAQGTISLSYCPDRAVPWPLRNAFRAPDGWVARVNGRVIDAPTAMTAMDIVWGKTSLVRDILNLALIEEAVTRRGITVAAEEMQPAMDAFRRKHRLLRKADMLKFFEVQGITQSALESHLESELLRTKLRDEMTQGSVDQYFHDHQGDFETAHVIRLRVRNEADARGIVADAEAGRRDFASVARERFVDGAAAAFVVLRRSELTEDQAKAVFGTPPGQVVAVASGNVWDAMHVLRIAGAVLDDATREQVKQAAFDAWLDEQRRTAQITWFWGDSERLRNQNNGWPS